MQFNQKLSLFLLLDWKDCKEASKNITWKESDYILFPMSDSDSLYSPNTPLTGSHWTLLAFIPSKKHFMEYDSLHKAPSKNAKAFADKLLTLLDLDSNTCTYSVETVPTQTNNYDCGIYVLQIMVRHKLFS
ncbi:sentrin-specific protease [Galdieria sulphuraria]|uniref:Sentrin-specific protease n=1 Tax=Galdieria sulphuraria TaxID=130081 RepID=M2XCP2_GALSU|nr:sentrin-specific protease [Galdieria sulphuraria]EME27717.1 sentrin-specific protease [Galdieria sulphuraria]|eukprot:XP_005704237.1 sentrin-specific protease [Galdieria sulphuraria]